MPFTHDTQLALATAAALVNTLDGGHDALAEPSGLADLLQHYPFSGEILGTADELASIRLLRDRLRALWSARDRAEAAGLVNQILAEADARPYLTKHDDWDWHLHLTRPEAPLAQRMGAEAAMGFLDLVREDALDRLRICAAEDCAFVLVDLSRNRSKRYCTEGNCGNRANVAAYRARKRG